MTFKLIKAGGAALALFATTLAAEAADLSRPVYKGMPRSVESIYGWSGCYVGVQAGYAWGTDKGIETVTATGATSAFSPTEAAKLSGAKLGGLVGCNWQLVGAWVYGLEGDADWVSAHGGVAYPNTGTPPDTYDASIRFQGSARGRIGYAFDRYLLYATAGVAFANIRHSYFQNGNGMTEAISTTKVGWTAGAGLEYAFTSNWIGRVEYRYAEFGGIVNQPAVYPGFTESHRITEHALRVAVAYKFSGPLFSRW